MSRATAAFIKASLTQLVSLESIEVLWNPQSYRLTRRTAFASAALPGSVRSILQSAAGGDERFSASLFLDTTGREGEARDLRPWASRLEAWAEPDAARGLPPAVLFHWGSFRFRGVIETLDQEWIQFDADGTPVRALLDLVLRR